MTILPTDRSSSSPDLCRAAALVVTMMLASGCIGPTRTRGRVIGGVTAGVGTLMLIDGVFGECTVENLNQVGKCVGHDAAPYLGAGLIALGAVVLAINELESGSSPESGAATAAPPAIVDLPDPETTNPTLRQLTLQASVASRRGNCSVVRVVANRIETIDAAYRRAGFMRDRQIVACL